MPSPTRNFYLRALRAFEDRSARTSDTVDACETLMLAFETIGYPDWWQDVTRLRSDAELRELYG